MLKFHCDVRPVNFVSLFFFCSCSNWNLASDFSGISSGVFSYTFYRAVMSCKLGGLCLNEPDPVHVWLYKKEADVFNSFNLPFFFFFPGGKKQTKANTPEKPTPNPAKQRFLYFVLFLLNPSDLNESQCVECQWFTCSPSVQLPLIKQRARVEWKPALCCRAEVCITEEKERPLTTHVADE